MRSAIRCVGGRPQETEIETIAAAANNLLIMPSPAKPALLRRFPLTMKPPMTNAWSNATQQDASSVGESDCTSGTRADCFRAQWAAAFTRCWKSLAGLRAVQEWQEARKAVQRFAAAHRCRAASARAWRKWKLQRWPSRRWILPAGLARQHGAMDSVAAPDAQVEVRWAGSHRGHGARSARGSRVSRRSAPQERRRRVLVDHRLQDRKAPTRSRGDCWSYASCSRRSSSYMRKCCAICRARAR